MKLINRYNGKIKIKRTKEIESPYPTKRDYFILNKMSNVDMYFTKMWNKNKFDSVLFGLPLQYNGYERDIAWKGMHEMRDYQKKTEKGELSKGEYIYFNLQKEKQIIKDLKKCKWDKFYRMQSCQFNEKINQLERDLK